MVCSWKRRSWRESLCVGTVGMNMRSRKVLQISCCQVISSEGGSVQKFGKCSMAFAALESRYCEF